MFVGLVLLLVTGLWRLSIRPDVIVKDSPEFVAALRVWHPLVVAKRNTPRSIKRFMNRVRYYAMRQKPLEHATSVLARLGAWFGYSRVNGQLAESTSIPEDFLVALSTIQHCYPEWLEDEELFKNFVGYLRQRDDLLPAEISTYLDTFSKGSLVGNYRQAFLKLSAGIRVM
jgi:hypothetical protein